MDKLQFLVLIYIESPMFIVASCDKSSRSQQTALIVEMGLFEDDRILIKKTSVCYGTQKLMKEFPTIGGEKLL